MKPYIASLRVGDEVEGRVVERLSEGDLIISFGGDLLRVTNETPLRFTAGDQVTLTVASVRPIRFRIPQNQTARKAPGRFDVLG